MVEPGIRHISLGDLRSDVNQPRLGTGDRDALDALKASMAELGRTVQYVTVSPNTDGSWRVVSGHRRVQAAAELGWHWLPAVVIDDVANEQDRLLRQIAENSARAGLRPHELCDAIGQLGDVVDPPAIARATGVSIRTVYNYLAILEHPDLVQVLRSGRSLRSVLTEVARRNQCRTGESPEPVKPASVRKVRRSVDQLVTSWSGLGLAERRRLAGRLRPLLDDPALREPLP